MLCMNIIKSKSWVLITRKNISSIFLNFERWNKNLYFMKRQEKLKHKKCFLTFWIIFSPHTVSGSSLPFLGYLAPAWPQGHCWSLDIFPDLGSAALLPVLRLWLGCQMSWDNPSDKDFLLPFHTPPALLAFAPRSLNTWPSLFFS